MHLTLVSGTKEEILIKIGDRLDLVTALGPLNPTFSVYAPDDTPKQTDIPATVEGMTAKCLVDTTVGGNWPSDEYRLYLKLTPSPQAPLLGPVGFKVEEI